MGDGVILGIDGGGSKTLVAAADQSGRATALLKGRATSPLEIRDWSAALGDQVRPLAEGPETILAAAAALAAYGEVEAVSAEQRGVVRTLFGDVPQRMLNDVDAAHLGAFAGGSGILILAGTGSMAWARDESGASHRTGGWGEVVGDEGSGRWIGRRVLEAVSQAIDGRAGPTGLVSAVFTFLRLDRHNPIDALEGWASRLLNPRTAIASLAAVAVREAQAGDPTARAIVSGAADELARHVRTLEKRFRTPSPDWSYAGGLFSAPLLRDALAERLGRPPRAPLLPPIGGALLAAAHELGWQTDSAWIERLAASITALAAGTEANQNKEREYANA